MSIVRRVSVQGIHRVLNFQPGHPSLHPKYAAMHPNLLADPLPQSVNLQSLSSPIKNQLNFGSCTAFASIALAEFRELQLERAKAAGPEVFNPATFQPLSEFYHYFNERLIDGDVTQDAGSSLSTSMQAFANYGCVPETAWPYDPTFMYRTPSPGVYTLGAQHKVTSTLQLNCLADMLHCLAQGFPFAAGLSLFDSFMTDQVADTGVVPLPNLSTESFQGGHALSFFGYDTAKQMILGRNSWGNAWGQNGWFWIPFAYLANPQLASDIHTLR